MISGADSFYALDVKEYASHQRNLTVFDELVELFSNRTGIPDDSEFPRVQPALELYEFPSHILSDQHLRRALSPKRLQELRQEVVKAGKKEGCLGPISYIVPWNSVRAIRPGSMDMVLSQAVLEHVTDLQGAYSALYEWLRPGGFMSHQIDFSSHGIARGWNGHWTYSDLTWRLIFGRRTYLLNRHPHSVHIDLLRKAGFEIVCDMKVTTPSSVARTRLAKRFAGMTQEDLTTSAALIQATEVAEA